MAFYSGTVGYVVLGSTTYSFGKWKLAIKAGAPKTTNYTSGGFQSVVPGVVQGDITVSGPWNVGSTPVAINGVYVFHLGLNTGVELVCTAQVTGIDPENDVEDTPKVSVTATSTGAFGAAIT